MLYSVSHIHETAETAVTGSNLASSMMILMCCSIIMQFTQVIPQNHSYLSRYLKVEAKKKKEKNN